MTQRRPIKTTKRGPGKVDDTDDELTIPARGLGAAHEELTEKTEKDQIPSHKVPPPVPSASGRMPIAPPPATPNPPLVAISKKHPASDSQPLQVISMKTPAEVKAEKKKRSVREHKVKLDRAIAPRHPTPPKGVLAPPRDAKDSRSRAMRDLMLWGSVVVIVGSLVMLAVWFAAR